MLLARPDNALLAQGERERALLYGERQILEMIATGVGWQPVLEAICRLFEAQDAQVRATILLVRDAATMHPGAAPSLPAAYSDELDGVPIGINVGSCGTAAFTKQRVIVEDIANSPVWGPYGERVLCYGLRACFSTPVLASDGETLGSFGIYFLTTRLPSPEQLELADRAANLASIALERRRTELRLASLHEDLERRIAQRTEALARAVDELSRAREAAEAASAAKTAFLANMSHEIRTPMNAILGFAQVLADDKNLSAAQTDKLRAIQHSGEHLLSVIDDVLEMAKIESGTLTPLIRPCSPRALLDDVERMFRLQAASKGLSLAIRVQPDVPRAVRTDQAKLRQVLINLIGNAIKFTQQGSVWVELSASAPSGEHVRLRFAVRDSGPGIAAEAQQALFQPFVQLGEPSAQRGGAGLGLAICKRLVELLGGSITLASEPGEGSAFTVELAVELAELPAPPRGEPLPTLGSGHPARKLLIVDDHDLNRQVLVELLSPFGFQILQAADGRGALSLFEQHRPALVLMDLRMPVMDGYEAMRRIRASAGGDNVRIVAVTASAFDSDLPRIRASGADEVLRKPFRSESLFRVIEAQLALLER